MKRLNILFTGVGRRIELLNAFKQAALNLDIDLKIYGADMMGTAPALAYCDFKRKVCSMKDPNYIEELMEICRQDKIDLIIPTIDTDLLVLSKNSNRFGKTKVLISEENMIAICRDKSLTSSFFEKCGCKAPKTVSDWKLYEGEFPCFIKPKDGSSSINTFRVESVKELELYAQQIEDYVVQPFIEGTEYTVDVFCDFEGNPIYITPRIRMQVRAGEVLKTQISMDEKIIEECRGIINAFKPKGPITIQLIRQNSTGDNYYIEINPRYGGGAPLSMKAGARSAEALIGILTNSYFEYNRKIIEGATYSRFDDSICIKGGDNTANIRGVIFDLDDTLYLEKEYVKSGYSAIEEFIGIEGAADKMWTYFEKGLPAVDMFLEEVGQLEIKDRCIELYRENIPNITLFDGVEPLIKRLKANGIKVGIITDGRPTGQRNKIYALGLDDKVDDIIITDELGGEQFRKPCDISFRIMQRRWKIPFEELIYIGDNIYKDFQAPKQLGMQWIHINNSNGIYCDAESLTEVSYDDQRNVYSSINDAILDIIGKVGE